MAEYAATYGGLPRPTDPWPLVIALARRTQRFDARAKLRLVDGVADAIGAAFGEDTAAFKREELYQAAYPTGQKGPATIPNAARASSEDPA